MSGQQIPGWYMPLGSSSFHCFGEADGHVMLRSVCMALYSTPWFVSRGVPLQRRGLHQEGNCLGCRAWLSIPRNRLELGAAA
ncbi:MAG TPA: hypothetical protein VN256_08240 [Pyrinomonadaceae bacterium]|nr:hypothetical protein [Pyrinomonadaceae bacterium]